MFYLSYIAAELRRRRGRSVLTALGLGVGVGLVVAVSALSAGLERAQDEVLEPLTGVGADLSAARPLDIGGPGEDGPFGNLSEKEREQLEEENGGGARVGLRDGEPGESFDRTRFMTTQLSFPASEVDEIRGLDGVRDAAGSLTLTMVTVSGEFPEEGAPGGPDQAMPAPAPGGGGPRSIDLESAIVTGVDVVKPELAPIDPDDITAGRNLADPDAREVVLNESYAKREDLGVGDTVKVGGKRHEVVGIARSPLGGQAADLYVGLSRLQAISGRKGRVNTVQVRAEDSEAVPAVERGITGTLEGASVTTAADLAARVGGSLTDAEDLSDRLGLVLTIVALVAAFLIASLLTLSSVAKRIRELGTLKALGWPQRKVVRQVTGESLAQGAAGGVIGALVGIAAAAAIDAAGITLEASVAAADTGGNTVLGGPGGDGAGAFGQGAVQSGATTVALEAPIDGGLIVLAIALALLGGLVAGSVGGLRAARLRPADALRHIG